MQKTHYGKVTNRSLVVILSSAGSEACPPLFGPCSTVRWCLHETEVRRKGMEVERAENCSSRFLFLSISWDFLISEPHLDDFARLRSLLLAPS